jgi:hypothetical protein
MPDLDQIEHHEAKLGPHVAAAATTVPGSGSDPGTLTGLPQGTLTFEATVDAYVLQYVGVAPAKAILQAVGVPTPTSMIRTSRSSRSELGPAPCA